MLPSRSLSGVAFWSVVSVALGVNLNLQTLQKCSCSLEGLAVDNAKTCSSDRSYSLVSQEPAQGQNLPLLFPFSLEATSKASVATTPMCNCDCPSRDPAFTCHLEPQAGDTDGSKNQVSLAYHVGNLPPDAIGQYTKAFCAPAINQINTVVEVCPGTNAGDEVACSVLNGGKSDAVVVVAASGDAASCDRTKDAIAGAICRRDPSLCKLADKLACLPQGGSTTRPAAHTLGAALGGTGLSVTNCLSLAAGLNDVLSKHAAGEYADCGVTTTRTTATDTTTSGTTTTTTTVTTTTTASSTTETSTTTTCTGKFYTSCPQSSNFVVSACYEECSTTSGLMSEVVQKCDATLAGSLKGLATCSGDDILLAGVDGGDANVDCEDFANALSRLVERALGTLETDVRALFTCGKYRIDSQPSTGFVQVASSKEEGEQCSDVTGTLNNVLEAVYSSVESCKLYGSGYKGTGNYVANQACCTCGGGVKSCSGIYDKRAECHPPETSYECFIPGRRNRRDGRLRLRRQGDDDECAEYADSDCAEINFDTGCCDESKCDTKDIDVGGGMTLKFCIPKPTTTSTTTTTVPGADKIAVVAIPDDAAVSCADTVSKLDSTLTDFCYMDSGTEISCKRLSGTHQMLYAGGSCTDAANKLKQLSGRFFSCLDGFITTLKTECEDVIEVLETTLDKVHAGEVVDHGCPTTTTATTATKTTATETSTTETSTTETSTTTTTTTNTATTEQYKAGSCQGAAEPAICGQVYGRSDCKPGNILGQY
eukprot:gene19427-30188_t